MDDPTHNWPNQTFILSPETVKAFEDDTLWDMVEDMLDAKVLNPPFESFSIQASASTMEQLVIHQSPKIMVTKEGVLLSDERAKITSDNIKMVVSKFDYLVNVSKAKGVTFGFELYARPPKTKEWKSFYNILVSDLGQYEGSSEKVEKNLGSYLYVALLVMLGVKNIKKETQHNKRKWVASGKYRSEYVTTLKIGHITETKSGDHHTGVTVCAHLRRGHIRHQPCGVGLTETKIVWIAPIFVNADKEYLQHRKEYRVTT